MPSPKKLSVGLLLCDDIDEVDRPKYGEYTDFFRRGLHAVDANIELQSVRAYQGELPASPDDFAGYIITGSRYSVYDSHPWIESLMAFVRDCRRHRAKTVGICFGHQLIAHACGGETRKSDNGWGFGVQRSYIGETQDWMDDAEAPQYDLIVIHQDQVFALPPGFRAIAANEFCPVSMFVDDGCMLGIQGHPEFDNAFCAFRAEARRDTIGEEAYRAAMDSLANMQPQSARVFGWMARFIRGAGEA